MWVRLRFNKRQVTKVQQDVDQTEVQQEMGQTKVQQEAGQTEGQPELVHAPQQHPRLRQRQFSSVQASLVEALPLQTGTEGSETLSLNNDSALERFIQEIEVQNA